MKAISFQNLEILLLINTLAGILIVIVYRYYTIVRERVIETIPKSRIRETEKEAMEETVRLLDSIESLKQEIAVLLIEELGESEDQGKYENISNKISQITLNYVTEHKDNLFFLIRLLEYIQKKDGGKDS